MGISGKLINALDHSTRMIVLTDLKGDIQYVNQTFIDKYGFSSEELIGKNPRVLNTGYHDVKFYKDLWHTITNGETWEGVFRNQSKEGRHIWEKACISPVKDDNGKITAYIAIKEDVTHERSISEHIERDHYFLEELFSNSPIGVVIVEPVYSDYERLEDLLIIKANPSAGRIIDRLGLVGLTVKEFLPDQLITYARLKIMLERKFSFEIHLKDIGKYLRFRSFPFGKNNVCIFFYDVSHYLSIIKALEASEERYFKLVEDSPAFITRFDDTGKLRYVNHQYCKFWGKQPEDLIGINFMDYLPPDEKEKVWSRIEKLTPEHPISKVEFKMLLDNGEEKWLHRLDRALVDSSGNIFEYQSISVDITEVKQTEDKLKRLNSTKDKLFSIIAHDVKNPFNVILGFSNLLKNNISQFSQEQIKDYVERILAASESVYKILDDLLIWAKSQLGQINVSMQQVRLISLVYEAYDNFSIHANEKTVELINEVDQNVEVLADMEMMRFVVRNLVHNGIKFSNAGSQVICSNYTDSKYEVLSVKDTGIGISPEKLKGIFDIGKFIATLGTAKEKGTGLGLNLAKDLVEKNGGKIEVFSEEGVGTEFKVYLPRA